MMGEASQDWIFYLGFVFYIINIVEISIDMALYFRNVRLDNENEIIIVEEV